MKTSKVTTIITSKELTTAFAGVKDEAKTLNATLRNMAARATLDSNLQKICKWLGITDANVRGNKLNDLRTAIISEVVYYTEGSQLDPVNMFKVAEIDGTNYYEPRAISWLSAVKMIANRHNASLEVMHEKRIAGAYYTASGTMIEDSTLIEKIEAIKELKKAEADEKNRRAKIGRSGDAKAIYDLASEIEASKNK